LIVQLATVDPAVRIRMMNPSRSGDLFITDVPIFWILQALRALSPLQPTSHESAIFRIHPARRASSTHFVVVDVRTHRPPLPWLREQ
jgi:hypothetical protein